MSTAARVSPRTTARRNSIYLAKMPSTELLIVVTVPRGRARLLTGPLWTIANTERNDWNARPSLLGRDRGQREAGDNHVDLLGHSS